MVDTVMGTTDIIVVTAAVVDLEVDRCILVEGHINIGWQEN